MTRQFVAATCLRSKPYMKHIWSTVFESVKSILQFNWIGEFRNSKRNENSTREL